MTKNEKSLIPSEDCHEAERIPIAQQKNEKYWGKTPMKPETRAES